MNTIKKISQKLGKWKILFVIPAIALMAASCDGQNSNSTSNSYNADTNKVESTQQKLQTAVPIPDLTNSAERQNISARAKAFDDINKVSYIYLISYGKVMAFYTVKGKVSSLNSYLTPLDKLVDSNGNKCGVHNTYGYDGGVDPCYAVSAPDIDGAYGQNADGIFFFTTDGVYVEWQGQYMMADQPLKLSTPPELVQTIK